jgi:hypothetical protein
MIGKIIDFLHFWSKTECLAMPEDKNKNFLTRKIKTELTVQKYKYRNNKSAKGK